MWIISIMMSTMMEENRGLMGKKRFSNVHIAGESLIGISNSNTTRMLRQSTELFRYCADGLAGWSPISSPPFINILAELRLTFSFILQFVLNCALRIHLYSFHLLQNR